MQFARYVGIFVLAAVLSACSTTGSKEKIPEDLSESQLYRQAQQALENSNYSSAITHFRALESRYPFGSYAEQSQLELIYAYYQNSEPEAAKASAERFIRLHPKHPNVDYAYYMKGLADNTADLGLIERYVPVDMSKRDPGRARESFNDFAELLNRFPDSQYAPDARKRMIYLRNQLAAYEIHVANYYLKRRAYVAAVNRGRYVVENMQRTPAVPAALAIMVEGYERLGLTEAANRTLDVLRLNYPDDPSLDKDGNFIGYKIAGDKDPSLLNIVTFGLLGDDGSGGDNNPSNEPPAKPTSASTEAPKDNGERSWLNILTFGLLGDDGKTQATVAE